MGWRFSNDGYGECRNAQGVKRDGRIIEIAEVMDAEGVDQTMADKKSGVDANDLAWCRLEASLHGS